MATATGSVSRTVTSPSSSAFSPRPLAEILLILFDPMAQQLISRPGANCFERIGTRLGRAYYASKTRQSTCSDVSMPRLRRQVQKIHVELPGTIELLLAKQATISLLTL